MAVACHPGPAVYVSTRIHGKFSRAAEPGLAAIRLNLTDLAEFSIYNFQAWVKMDSEQPERSVT